MFEGNKQVLLKSGSIWNFGLATIKISHSCLIMLS